jgi:hypothetical protein
MEPGAVRIKAFRDLIAWQKAMELARLMYKSTAEMPDTERFGLTNQMRLIRSLEPKA